MAHQVFEKYLVHHVHFYCFFIGIEIEYKKDKDNTITDPADRIIRSDRGRTMIEPHIKKRYKLKTSRGYATVYFVDNMPETIHGAVERDQQGIIIMINASLSHDDQSEAMLHELTHINMGHLDQDCQKSAEQCEQEVRSRIRELQERNQKYN